MATVAEITVQPTNDPNVKAYHSRFEMCEAPQAAAKGDAEGLDEFAKLFFGVRGVSRVTMSPYVLLITKAQLFEWEEISPGVEGILKDFVRSQRLIIEALKNGDEELEPVKSHAAGKASQPGRNLPSKGN